MLLSSDTISHEATDPIKSIIYVFFSGIAIYESIQSNIGIIYIMNNGEITVVMTPLVLIIQTPFFLFYNLTYLFTLGKMIRHAPSKLKIYTQIAFWGYVILVIPGLVFMIINPYTNYIFSGIQFIFVTIGILMLNFTILKQPKMIFILPFKAVRLTILHAISGIALFDYKWEQNDADLNETLYTSMLQGVNLILEESLDRGRIEEIKTSRAIILAHHCKNYPIRCILVSVKASKTLREALKQFAEKFEDKYAKFLTNYSETSNFDSAIELIKQYFPFVPQ